MGGTKGKAEEGREADHRHAEDEGGREGGRRAGGGPQARPMTRGARPVTLLALFEGLGTSRLAVGAAINKAGGTAVLCASWYAEWQPVLYEAAERYWQQRTRLTGCAPHLPAAKDVWDVLRGAGGIQKVLDSTPRGAMLLMAGDHHASN